MSERPLRKYQVWADLSEPDQVADTIDLDANGNLWLTEGDQVVGLAIAGSFKAVTSEPLDPSESTNSAPSVPAPPPAPPLHDVPEIPAETPTQQLLGAQVLVG